jgi:hypothetical protein
VRGLPLAAAERINGTSVPDGPWRTAVGGVRPATDRGTRFAQLRFRIVKRRSTDHNPGLERKCAMRNRRQQISERAGKIKYGIAAWLLGLPLPIIILALLWGGCDF